MIGLVSVVTALSSEEGGAQIRLSSARLQQVRLQDRTKRDRRQTSSRKTYLESRTLNLIRIIWRVVIDREKDKMAERRLHCLALPQLAAWMLETRPESCIADSIAAAIEVKDLGAASGGVTFSQLY